MALERDYPSQDSDREKHFSPVELEPRDIRDIDNIFKTLCADSSQAPHVFKFAGYKTSSVDDVLSFESSTISNLSIISSEPRLGVFIHAHGQNVFWDPRGRGTQDAIEKLTHIFDTRKASKFRYVFRYARLDLLLVLLTLSAVSIVFSSRVSSVINWVTTGLLVILDGTYLIYIFRFSKPSDPITLRRVDSKFSRSLPMLMLAIAALTLVATVVSIFV